MGVGGGGGGDGGGGIFRQIRKKNCDYFECFSIYELYVR